MTELTTRTNNVMMPWAGFQDLENELERIFHGDAPVSGVGTWMPAVDLYETEDAYVLEADLPGMKKEDIDLQVLDDRIILKGTRKREERAEEKGFHRYERAEGQFERSFRIGDGIDPEKVEAKFEHGVLMVTLPKPETAKPRQIDVKTS